MAKESWAQTRRAPLPTPRFAFDAAGKQAKDVHSNSLGGITQPFADSQLKELYGTFAAYQAKMRTATDTAVRRGWLLPEDARDQMRRVCTAAAGVRVTAAKPTA